jgi:hypothetical protein
MLLKVNETWKVEYITVILQYSKRHFI